MALCNVVTFGAMAAETETAGVNVGRSAPSVPRAGRRPGFGPVTGRAGHGLRARARWSPRTWSRCGCHRPTQVSSGPEWRTTSAPACWSSAPCRSSWPARPVWSATAYRPPSWRPSAAVPRTCPFCLALKNRQVPPRGKFHHYFLSGVSVPVQWNRLKIRRRNLKTLKNIYI